MTPLCAPVDPILLTVTCPLCCTVGPAMDALVSGSGWRCTRCHQRWEAVRLATVAAYA